MVILLHRFIRKLLFQKKFRIASRQPTFQRGLDCPMKFSLSSGRKVFENL